MADTVWKTARPYIALVAVAIAALWAFSALFRESFFDENHAIWRAKAEIIVGAIDYDLLVFGDSKALSGIVPALFPARAASLATNGTSTVAQFLALERYLKNHRPPRAVIYSVSPVRFVQDEYFWFNTTKFFDLPLPDLMSVVDNARRLKDYGFSHASFAGCPPCMSFRLYALRAGFPFLFRDDFVHALAGGGIGGHPEVEAAVLARAGYYVPPLLPEKTGLLGREANRALFQPAPLLSFYFDEFLRLSREKGIEVHFVFVPTNPASFVTVSPEYRRGVLDFLERARKRYPNLRIHGEMHAGNPADFADQDHMNEAGAAAFTGKLRRTFAFSR